jgi:hypothetical protein
VPSHPEVQIALVATARLGSSQGQGTPPRGWRRSSGTDLGVRQHVERAPPDWRGACAVLASERTVTLPAIWDRGHLSQRRVSQGHELLPGGAAPRSHAGVGAGRTGAYAPSSRGDLPWSPQQSRPFCRRWPFCQRGLCAPGAYAPQGGQCASEAYAPHGAYAPHSRGLCAPRTQQAVGVPPVAASSACTPTSGGQCTSR